MSVYVLAPISRTRDECAPMWFDDDACTWDEPSLHKAASLKDVWQAPQLRLHRPATVPTQVLFNPNAFAVSDPVRSKLSVFSEIEFLPVQIAMHGTFFILHVVACIPIPEGCNAHRPSNRGNPGNVVLVHSFPDGFHTKHPFFRLLQPADSPWGRQGGCMQATYLTAEGRKAIESVCSGLLYGAPLPRPLTHRCD